MVKAKKKDNGKWKIQPSKMVGGKLIRKTFTCDTKREAEQKAAKWVEEIVRETTDMTFSQAVDKYIDMKSAILSPSTIRGYRIIQKHSAAEIADVGLSCLDKIFLQEFANELAKKYSPKTVKNAFGLIFAVLNQFTDERIPKVSLPPLQKPKTETLNGEQIGRFITAIRGHRSEIPLLLAVWLGLRKSEIIGLKWDDIDLENGVLYIHTVKVQDEHQNYVVKKNTKTYSSNRILFIPPYIVSKLQSVEDKTGYVYKLSPDFLYKDAKKVAENIGVKNVGLHDLRRTMATMGLSLNISDKVMMQRGGWSNSQTMKRVYQTVFMKDAKIASEAIDSYVMDMVSRQIQDTETA